jgi:FKBP-type peptidyl-prolyl cis-trans isomerase
MLNNRILITAVVVFATAWGCDKADPKIETDMDKASYSIGYDIGSNLREQGIDDINLDAMLLGMRDAQSGTDGVLSDDEMMMALETFQRLMMDRMEAKSASQGIENLAVGEAFLAENAQKEGVVTTASGLQYRVIEEGSGRKPSATDRVTVHYIGSLLDGTEFDSSVSRGQPATFGLNQVIQGWSEGVQLMTVGSKYEFFVPADLGYGERGTPGGPIGPNATLIFEVELLGIE